jgi:hypothetical protein
LVGQGVITQGGASGEDDPSGFTGGMRVDDLNGNRGHTLFYHKLSTIMNTK